MILCFKFVLLLYCTSFPAVKRPAARVYHEDGSCAHWCCEDEAACAWNCDTRSWIPAFELEVACLKVQKWPQPCVKKGVQTALLDRHG